MSWTRFSCLTRVSRISWLRPASALSRSLFPVAFVKRSITKLGSRLRRMRRLIRTIARAMISNVAERLKNAWTEEIAFVLAVFTQVATRSAMVDVVAVVATQAGT